MANNVMPIGDYDKSLESSEALSLYEGSRFMRFIKDTLAGFKYGTKNNPKVKGNKVSYIDAMGRLITQEKTTADGENNTKIEKIVRKISTSAKTEAFNSIEVIEKTKNDKNELSKQVRNFYPSVEDYEERAFEPKIKEITYYQNNETYLRQTIERLLSEDEMRKRFEIGAIKLNPLAPDSVKKEIVKSKMIYTVDKQKTESEMDEKLKRFGTHLQINETEKTYITSADLNPEFDELKDYVGPKEFEKDIILYSSNEPKARIEEMDNITFSVGKIHHISTSISNYPDTQGNYGGEGRGTYAVYDDKILHATGNKCIFVHKNADGKFETINSKDNTNTDSIIKAELRGTQIDLSVNVSDNTEATSLIAEMADCYKEKWGITKNTVIEYTLTGNGDKFKVKYQDLKKNTTKTVKKSEENKEETSTIETSKIEEKS